MRLKGTKSEQNLKAAFAGESQARNKYTYFSTKAHEEGYEETAQLFERMAENEKEHAKIWFKTLFNGIYDTDENVQDAAMGENQEWRTMYPQFAREAREEGFEALAKMFENVAGIEKSHEESFLKEFVRLKGGIAATAQEKIKKRMVYRCAFCGQIHEVDTEPPTVCPVCEAINPWERVTI